MVYSEKFYVGFSDVGPDLKITNASILRLFENASCLQGEAVGDGYHDSFGRWFLTAYSVKVFKRPEYNDFVTVNTWSRELKGFTASREFELYGADGSLAAVALSNWARMNTAVGKLERMAPEVFARYESEPLRHNFDDAWLPKLRDCSDYSIEREITAGRLLIDPNGHVNNVRYLDIASEIIPEDVYKKGEADRFEITYRKAIAYGETVRCLYSETPESYTVTIKSDNLKDTMAIIRLYKNGFSTDNTSVL